MATMELVPAGTTQLAQYGERADIKELGERMRRFLPNGDKMQAGDALSFAQASLALDLNPFAGEIWYIPRVGIVTGIAGYRKMARQQGPFVAQCRQMTPAERADHNLKDQDLGAVCELYRPDQLRGAAEINLAAGKEIIPIAPTLGIGIWRAAELETKSGRKKAPPTARSWRWIAEKRAEADALRKAFDLTLSYAETGSRIIDGEVVSEEPVQLSDWAVKALADERPVPDQAEIERKRAILRGTDEDADWDAPGAHAEPQANPRQEAEAPLKTLTLPVAWTSFAQLAQDQLGYRNDAEVIGTLHANGIERVCNTRNVVQFVPLDAWTILQDNAPARQAALPVAGELLRRGMPDVQAT